MLGLLKFVYDYLLPRKHLPIQIQQYKQLGKVWNIFKINMDAKNNIIDIFLVPRLLTLKVFKTPFFSLYTVDIEYAFVCWLGLLQKGVDLNRPKHSY